MAIHMIRRYLHFLGEGKIFTTRDCLIFGMRAAVDQALYQMVKTGRIRRLARGVFANTDDLRIIFTELEIVRAKAHAFGRKIIEDHVTTDIRVNCGSPSINTSVRTEVSEDGTLIRTYPVEGHSSSFRIGGTTIKFKKTGQRKFELNKTKAGRAAKSVWNMGSKEIDGVALQDAVLHFDRFDYVDMRFNIRWMPAWLSDQIKCRPWHKSFENKVECLS
jgi:hypothetical protein